ncbi:MAG: nitroreductase family deazaflavin-dependent oxidoreductase [Acidimicrobiia bacterium]
MAKQYRVGTVRKLINKLATSQVKKGRGHPATYLLTTTGRTSGLSRTTPVTLVIDGTERWLVAPYGAVGWVHNLRASGIGTLERGVITEEITVSELPPALSAPVLATYHAKLKRVVGAYMDVPRSGATEEQFLAIADRHPVFLIDSHR